MKQFTINSPAVAALAKELRPDAKKISNNDKGCSLTLLIIKNDISNPKHKGERVYSLKDAAKLRYPDYDDAGTSTQEGHVDDIRRFGLKLTNMSSLTRGSTAIGIVMMNEDTVKLYKTAKKTGTTVDVVEVAKTYLRWLPYTHVGAFSNLNGEWVIGWDEAQRFIGEQKAIKAAARAQGWKSGHIASTDAVKQLGVLSELALAKSMTPKLQKAA